MVKKFPYFVLGIPLTLAALRGIFGIRGNGYGHLMFWIFMGLLILGLVLIFSGIKAKTVKKQEFEACIINLNGTRKLCEFQYMEKEEARSLSKMEK
ncbi:hypothetical protein AALB39_25495 [Lachnospiraceae bacterium 54-53]